jgi:catechol 2,3-dioxygenase-like lactoylglutathione lyase family enzyme
VQTPSDGPASRAEPPRRGTHVPRCSAVERLTETLDAAGVPNSGVKTDPLGPTMVAFRDPDNIQWEFFEQA